MKIDMYYYGQHSFNSLVFMMEKNDIFAHVLFSDLKYISLWENDLLFSHIYISFLFFFLFSECHSYLGHVCKHRKKRFLLKYEKREGLRMC